MGHSLGRPSSAIGPARGKLLARGSFCTHCLLAIRTPSLVDRRHERRQRRRSCTQPRDSGVGPATTDHQPATLHGDIIAMCTGLCLAIRHLHSLPPFRRRGGRRGALVRQLMASALALVMAELTAVGPTGGALDFGVGFLAIIASTPPLSPPSTLVLRSHPDTSWRRVASSSSWRRSAAALGLPPLWRQPTCGRSLGAVLIVSLTREMPLDRIIAPDGSGGPLRLAAPPGRDMIVPAKGGAATTSASATAHNTASLKVVGPSTTSMHHMRHSTVP